MQLTFRLYQRSCIRLGILKKCLALFLDPGLGKTAILLAIACHLLKYKKAKGVLVVAPLNPLYLTWLEEIKQWTRFRHLTYTVLHAKKNKTLNAYRKTDLYFINPESLVAFIDNTRGKELPFDVLMVDESGKFKSTSSIRTKRMLKFAKQFKYRYIANGTPTGNGYEGLFSQMHIVDGGETLGKTKAVFYDKYFRQVGKPEWRQYELKDKFTADIMLKDISKYAICMTAEDYINMPERIINPRYITLPARAKKAYDNIAKELGIILRTEKGRLEYISDTAAARAMYLHQICNGAIYVPTDPLEEYVPPLDRGYTLIHQEKLKALDELIEELNGAQLLVGYRYKSDAQALATYFKKRITFFDKKDALNIQNKWNSGKIQVLAGQISSLSHGLNLQKSNAEHLAVYSLTGDFEVFDQFTRRVYRSGNNAKTVFVHLILAKGLYDDAVTYASLRDRSKRHNEAFTLLQKHISRVYG